MGRRAARALHLALSAVGAALYFLFVIPRWWVLTGDIPASLATAGRIATGFPVVAAAIPAALILKDSRQSKEPIPELALRLRAWSAILHLVAGALIIVTAMAEVWLPRQSAGPWLFGVYGAAGSVATLAIAAFVLSFTAEKPPAPAKSPKPKSPKPKSPKSPKKRRTRTGDAAPEEVPGTGAEAEPDTGEPDGGAPAETAIAETIPETTEPAGAEAGALRNRRPTGKTRHRLRR